MLPTAHLIHQTRDRLRLRIPSRRGQAAYFERVVAEFAGHPGVDRIETNPVTGSVLLTPAVELAALVERAERAGLFTLGDPDATAPVPLAIGIARGFQDLNNQVRQLTGGGLDLASLGLVTLAGAAAVQLARGHVLASASTLLWYASELMRSGLRRPS